MDKETDNGDDYVDKQLSRKNVLVFIVLLKTFGIIAILIPLTLLFIMELMWDPSMKYMMAAGVALLVISFVWNYFYTHHH